MQKTNPNKPLTLKSATVTYCERASLVNYTISRWFTVSRVCETRQTGSVVLPARRHVSPGSAVGRDAICPTELVAFTHLDAQEDQGSDFDVLMAAWLSLRLVFLFALSSFSKQTSASVPWDVAVNQTVKQHIMPLLWVNMTLWPHSSVLGSFIFFLWWFNNRIFPLGCPSDVEICCERHSTATVWCYGTRWLVFTHR